MDDVNWNASQAAVLGNIGSLLDEDRSAVLVTVVGVEGNAYRRPGAKMLIRDDRSDVGSVSAGCLEPQIERIADEVLQSDEPRLETFDLTGDTDDDVWGLGLGCDGIMTLLFEPLTDALRPATEAFENGETVVAVTPLEGDSVGARAYFDEAGEEIQASSSLPDWITAEAGDVIEPHLDSGQSGTVTLERGDRRVDVFVDVVEARPELVVFGSGHDVAPLVELGRQSGFRVTVVSLRGADELSEKFPRADAHVTTSAPDITDHVRLTERSYAVLMTHNFVDDRIVLEALLDSPVPYIGLMGPRERFEEMRDEFQREDRSFSSEELDRIYTPIGLNLGGGEPYQIALSIVAEILVVHNDREPIHLKDREGPIHPRLEPAE